MPEFKLFTLEEAERTLPLVRRIVADLTLEYPAWRAAVGRFDGSITVLKPFERGPDGRCNPSYRDLFPEPPPAGVDLTDHPHLGQRVNTTA